MDKYIRKALLFDVYGPLLTSRQQEVYELVHNEDLSLGEIAENLAISRQAVHDMVKRTDVILSEYEEKLGLAGKFLEISKHLERVRQQLQKLEEHCVSEPLLAKILTEIEAIDAVERR